jgi:hypothetical protein
LVGKLFVVKGNQKRREALEKMNSELERYEKLDGLRKYALQQGFRKDDPILLGFEGERSKIQRTYEGIIPEYFGNHLPARQAKGQEDVDPRMKSLVLCLVDMRNDGTLYSSRDEIRKGLKEFSGMKLSDSQTDRLLRRGEKLGYIGVEHRRGPGGNKYFLKGDYSGSDSGK